MGVADGAGALFDVFAEAGISVSSTVGEGVGTGASEVVTVGLLDVSPRGAMDGEEDAIKLGFGVGCAAGVSVNGDAVETRKVGVTLGTGVGCDVGVSAIGDAVETRKVGVTLGTGDGAAVDGTAIGVIVGLVDGSTVGFV